MTSSCDRSTDPAVSASSDAACYDSVEDRARKSTLLVRYSISEPHRLGRWEFGSQETVLWLWALCYSYAWSMSYCVTGRPWCLSHWCLTSSRSGSPCCCSDCAAGCCRSFDPLRGSLKSMRPIVSYSKQLSFATTANSYSAGCSAFICLSAWTASLGPRSVVGYSRVSQMCLSRCCPDRLTSAG